MTQMIRKAKVDDKEELLAIFQSARKFMDKSGNPNQWPETYPGPNFEKEIENKEIYVIENETEVIGVFRLMSHDPCYDHIEGQWFNEKPYLAIHRVAKKEGAKGIMDTIVNFTKTLSPNIKIDTHRNNLVMQDRLKNLDFKYCGIIHIENGEERLAYQYSNKK